jgi:hypothetical protein
MNYRFYADFFQFYFLRADRFLSRIILFIRLGLDYLLTHSVATINMVSERLSY